MEIDPRLLQFGGSLIAILMLTGLTYALRLGGEPRLAGDAAAQRAANEVMDGFEADAIAVSTNGRAALLRDDNGQIAILKPHGSHFAGRILNGNASAHVGDSTLSVDSGEARFGIVHLTVTQPEIWADAINQLRPINND